MLNRKLKWALWFGLLIAIILTYGEVMVELGRDWLRDPNYHHGALVPLIVGYLIWRRRDNLGSLKSSPSNLGIIGIAFSMTMFSLGTAGAEVFTQRVSFILVLASLALFLFGWRHLSAISFPLAFLLLAIPLPYVVYYGVTGPMQALAAKWAVWALRGVGVQAAGQGNIIHLANTTLEVAEACSGIRSLYAFLAFGALAAYSTPVAAWARLLVFLMAIPLSVVGNSFRVFGSGIGAWIIGPTATEGTIHEFFGLLVFAGSLLVFLLVKEMVRRLWSPG